MPTLTNRATSRLYPLEFPLWNFALAVPFVKPPDISNSAKSQGTLSAEPEKFRTTPLAIGTFIATVLKSSGMVPRAVPNRILQQMRSSI